MAAADRHPRPPGELALVPKYQWLDLISALNADRTLKLVAFAMANFASKNGKDARPGTNRLMWTCRISDERTVNRAVKELRNLGLIYLNRAGGGRPAAGRKPLADEYWLTRPKDGMPAEFQTTPFEVWLKSRQPPKPGQPPKPRQP